MEDWKGVKEKMGYVFVRLQTSSSGDVGVSIARQTWNASMYNLLVGSLVGSTSLFLPVHPSCRIQEVELEI